jgi:hypothetical protein
MKENKQFKLEISDFIKSEIFYNFNYKEGLTKKDFKILSMELCGYGFKITKIKTKNKQGIINYYSWREYQNIYSNDWLIKLLKDLKFIKNLKYFIIVSINKKEFEKIKS